MASRFSRRAAQDRLDLVECCGLPGMVAMRDQNRSASVRIAARIAFGPEVTSNVAHGWQRPRGRADCCELRPTSLDLDPCMILSGLEIQNRMGGDVVIDPFEPGQLNPNSYNLRLHNELLVYEEVVLDMRRPNRHRRIEIPPEGIVLDPGRLYLGRTLERTETHNLVPMLEGRSSIGRLGLFVHITAGFGDVGFCGYWTLEMFAVQPIRVYAGIEICQIFYHSLAGDVQEYRSDKYQHNRDIQPSLLYREFAPQPERQMKLDFQKSDTTELKTVKKP